MAELSSDTILQRAPSLNVELGANTIIHVAGQRVYGGANALNILQAFAHPVTFSSAIKGLSEKISGAQAWIELVSSITNLYKAGVLVDETGATQAVVGTGWSAPEIHVVMLNDRVRTETFVRAIEATVCPGDVVVDIGTGTGVLALAAARAGARHVYAIEASAIGRAAEEMFAANGIAERVTLLPGWSSQVELPERADVLIAEIIGNDPAEEGVMETFADARKRFLVSDPRMIPGRVQTFAIPVTIDEKVLAKHAFTLDATSNWKDWYGIDFDPLLTSPLNKSVVFRVAPSAARDWPQLSSPVALADLDLSGTKHPLVNESVDLVIETPGMLGGLLVYFELDVSPGQRISTSPAVASETCSWAVKVWASGNQIQVQPGDRFKINYKYRVDSAGTKIELIPSKNEAG